MEKNEQLPYKLMVLIALAQGFCLLYLHQAIELDYWPSKQPQWLFTFYSVALIFPVMLLLSINTGNITTIVKYSLPFTLLSGLLGYYIGLQATPIEHIRYGALLVTYALTISLATFKALMYIQQMATGEKISYSHLFRWSWRNFLTLSLSLLFALCIWLILVLWAALFKAIGVYFFKDLFEQPWFYYPVIALANGFGVIIFRNLSLIIDTITRLQQALMKFLLVLLIFISILFLFTLPFTGLTPLWESGGSALILWMQALILFFINAVYQDDPTQRPYTLWLHRFIYIGVALLPIYSAIVFYGLSLRVDQYGWSLARCWAFLIWFLLALFPVGYLWGIVKKRDNWGAQLSSVNVFVGLMVLAAMLAINSPLLDFRKIVVSNQLVQLDSKKITLDDFDIRYFRQQLARPGYDALQQLKEEYAATHPEIAVRINLLYKDKKEQAPTQEEFITAITILAENVPKPLLKAIYKYETKWAWGSQSTAKYYLQSVDLDGDSQLDYVLASQNYRVIDLTLFYFEDDQWKNIDMNATHNLDEQARKVFIDALKSGDFIITQPRWKHLKIDEKIFRVEMKKQ